MWPHRTRKAPPSRSLSLTRVGRSRHVAELYLSCARWVWGVMFTSIDSDQFPILQKWLSDENCETRRVARCAKHDELFARVQANLDRLADLSRSAAEAFREGDRSEFSRLDREIEKLTSDKQRRIGALREHENDHRCQPAKACLQRWMAHLLTGHHAPNI